ATWEGVTRTAQAYYEWSDGESFFGRDAFANYMIVGSKQLGKPIITVENGQASMELDEAVMKKLWDNYYVPYVKGYFKQEGRYRTDDLKIGEIVAIVGATSGMVYFPTEVTKGNEEPQPIDYMILPLPNFEGTQPCMVLQGADMAVLSSTEAQEYASTLFLQWLTEAEHNTAFAVQAGYLPVKKSANQPGAVTDYIAEHKVVLKQIQQDTIDAALTQIASGELYTLPGFKDGDEVRNLLNDSMNRLAISDRAVVLKQVEDGIDEERALTPYLSQAHFEAWLADMRQQLEAILSKR
ncbi:MAG: extracellular solute-binding protein, partial [Lachnospiraceae bacterium]